MVRDTVGMAAGKAALFDEEETVVVVTVCVVVVVDCGVDCASASVAVVTKVKARDSVFTRVLNLGEMRAD
jgi:hypothetical protein